MILADRIRLFVLNNYINPARKQNFATVTIVSGEVHAGLGLENRMPAVCGALDAVKFLSYAHVRLVSRSGPHQSSTVAWIFEMV